MHGTGCSARRVHLPSRRTPPLQVHTPLLVQLVARLGRGEACAGAEDCLRAARELRWPEAVLRATRGLKSFSEYARATHPWPLLIPALTQPWPSP